MLFYIVIGSFTHIGDEEGGILEEIGRILFPSVRISPIPPHIEEKITHGNIPVFFCKSLNQP